MARKLGEILVAGQLLAATDLKKALDAQLIFGGRLGTNLLELGFLDEATLARALREQKRVEVASSEMLATATEEALRLIPSKVADKHKVIPLQLVDKKLVVAMVDPTDLVVLDELAFMTGCSIQPYLAPEVRLLGYLERYYKIPRPMRYIKLSHVVETKAPARATGPKGPPSPRPTGQAPTAQGPAPSINDLLGVKPGEQVTPQALKEASQAAPEQRQQLEAAVQQLAEQRRLEKAQAQVEPEKLTLAEASARLAEADSREEIGEALAAHAASQFPRVLTFVLQKDRALGWMARLPGRSLTDARQAARSIVLPLDQPSVVQTVVQTGQYYLGELPARPGDELLAQALGAPRPLNLVILPVLLSERCIMALYGDNLDQPLSGFDMRGLRAICQKAALAMEVLVLRSRIRQG